MEATLSALGEELVTVSSGSAALRTLLSHDFAVILLDVQMPTMNGLETASLIRMRERTRHVPIIFVTAYSPDQHLISQAYEHGAVDYLIKPFDPAVLRAKVWFFTELWRRGRQLERKARDIARAEAAATEAQNSAEFERRLLGIVSHDIRSPLSAVKATLATLVSQPQLSEAARKKALARAVRGVNRIEQLTHLFLDVTRARVGGGLAIAARPADMRELCRSAIEEVELSHPSQPIHFQVDDGDGAGIWDPLRIHQLLTNLIGNAVKYAARASDVEVRVQLSSPLVSVCVHNWGPPIQAAQLSGLFEPFARASVAPPTAQQDSHGLGLYIVREIVIAHGGDVSATSDLQKGTKFTVTLPREPPFYLPPPAPSEGAANHH